MRRYIHEKKGITMEKKPTSGLAVAGLVLGIIVLFSAFVPLLNLLSFPFVLLAIIFGAIGLIQTTSPAVALHAQVFQNGTELEMAITTGNEDAGKYMNDVKPGSSITYGLAYELEDTSDITVEVQELAAFNDVLLAGIAPAGGQPAFAGGRRQRAARGFAPPLIHRDLKPSNIVVSDGGLTIIDFGIARAFREGTGADTTHFGTRSYAPPEQFGYGQTDVRSDVYALGMLLYYLVTERDPDARVAMGGFAEPDVPPMLRPVLQRACAFDPAARFSSVRALKAAFLAAMASALGLPR